MLQLDGNIRIIKMKLFYFLGVTYIFDLKIYINLKTYIFLNKFTIYLIQGLILDQTFFPQINNLVIQEE